MKIFSRQNTPSSHGSALVETIVAIFILVSAITAAFGVAASGISAGGFARDNVTAFYLAQDAIEYIKNVRDTNAIQGLPWLSGITDNCASGQNCTVDTVNESIMACVGACPFLNKDTNDVYSYTAGSANSKFRRIIQITPVLGSSVEVQIAVTVSWAKGSFTTGAFTTREIIFDWYNAIVNPTFEEI